MTPLDDKSYSPMIQRRIGVAVVFFSATYCAPCRALKPAVSAEMAKHPQIPLFCLDVEKFPKLAAQLEIRNVPTILVFKDGKVSGPSCHGIQQLRDKLATLLLPPSPPPV